MTAAELLDQLERLDIHVRLDGEHLRLSAPPGVLTSELAAELRERRAELIGFLRKAGDHSAGPALIGLQPQGSLPPFFGIPGHSGNVFDFLPLAHALGREQPLLAYQPPGVHGQRTPLNRIEDLADDFIAQLRAFQPQGPYRIGGFCTGGTIAFEAARRLIAAGDEVGALVMFGSSSPPTYTLGHRLRVLPVRVLNRCLRLARRIPAGEPADSGVARDNRVRVEQEATKAVRSYRPGAYPGAVVLFIPSNNWRGLVCEGYMAWERSCAGLELHVGPAGGMHRTMLHEPDVQLVAQRLQGVLSRIPDRHARAGTTS